MLYVLFFENSQGQLEYLKNNNNEIEWYFDIANATKFETVADANRFRKQRCVYRTDDIVVMPVQ